jgi:hypothetical protein
MKWTELTWAADWALSPPIIMVFENVFENVRTKKGPGLCTNIKVEKVDYYKGTSQEQAQHPK